MEFTPTQVYSDEDFQPTQQFSYLEENVVQIGTLSINSTKYQIKTGITKIGRFGSCDIVLNDTTVSKEHAEIEASTNEASVWICDLKSSNNTKLNNLTLRPTRLYELKDGSVIEFGKVRAIYRTYHPADDTVVPETPAPTRQKIVERIIPNTPDSPLNNSSTVNDDNSIICGTQNDEENSVFRRPQMPQQRQSTNIGKKSANISTNESNDSQSDIVLQMSSSDNSEKDQGISIYDMETQNIEEGHKTVMRGSIHDMETQNFFTNASKLPEMNVKTDKRSSSIRDKILENSAVNIHDMETQIDMVDFDQQKAEKGTDVRNVTAKRFAMNIHDMETQNDLNATDNDENETQIGTDRIERSIYNLETQKLDDKHFEDISDKETQFELGVVTSSSPKSSDFINKAKDKATVSDAVKSGTNNENTKESSSRSSTPESLNLSSPGIVDEDYPSSPLNESAHLLESTNLLEYFGEGLDKQEVQVPNASTPKSHSKESEDNNARNVANTLNNADENDNDDEDIFDAPTQCLNRKFEDSMSDDSENNDALVTRKKKPQIPTKKLQSKRIDDDSETDAEEYVEELAEKQRKFLETSNKSCNENTKNTNDPGTSVESEDMFNMPTQSCELSKTNQTDAIVDNVAPTQVINTVGNTRDQDNLSEVLSTDISDTAPTQILLPREASPKTVIERKDPLSENDQNDVDDTAPTQIINVQVNTKKSIDRNAQQDLDCEDIDYEMAPTQLISEFEGMKNPMTEKTIAENSKVDLNDTLERNLNEMFDDVNNEKISNPSQLSTQCLEDILESSQIDNDLPTETSTIDNNVSTNIVSRTKRGKQSQFHDQSSHNLPNSKAKKNNVNNVNTDIDSQNSDVYFSTITTRRKRNIIRDETQELIDSTKSVTISKGTNSSQTLKESTGDDNAASGSKKKEERVSRSKNKSDDLIHDDTNKSTPSVSNNVKKSKLKQNDRIVSKARKAMEMNACDVKVNDAKKDLANGLDTGVPCSSEDEEGALMSSIAYESDDDILTRLPAVRISGTLSNPPSPSTSSTSTVHSIKSKRDVARGKNKIKHLKDKSLHERNDGDFETDENPIRVNDKSLRVPPIYLKISKTSKMLKVKNISEDSDSETTTSYERFKQMADRMMNNELNYLKKEKKKTDFPSNISKDPKQNVNVEGSKRSLRTSSRTIRLSNRNNDESSCVFQVTKERTDTIEKSKPKVKLTIVNRKRLLKTAEEDLEETSSKKYRADEVVEKRPLSTYNRRNTAKSTIDKQSPNIFENSTKIKSRTRSSATRNVKNSEDDKATENQSDESMDSGMPNIKRSRRKINDSPVAMYVSDVIANATSIKNKPTQKKKKETQTMQAKVLKVLLHPLVGPESQEVKMIMKKAASNMQDQNLSVQEKSNGRTLRSLKRKGSNIEDVEASSSSIESNASSDRGEPDRVVRKTKRGRQSKSSIPPLQGGASVQEKKDVFKKPTRFNQNSSPSTCISSTENIDKNVDQNSTNNTLLSSRASRSKIARTKSTEMSQNKNSIASSSTSPEIGTGITNMHCDLILSRISTPSRARKSMSSSILSNSSPSKMKHKILFTGITEDVYSKVVKKLGGSKVEDPEKCTVLVTDKVRRTYKFLCALAKGIPIVAIDWLTDSESSAQFLDWEGYILKDPVAEAKFGFRLRKSLDKAREKRLLDGYTVVLTPGVAPPPIEELKDMVTSCGGKVLVRPPATWPEKAVIVSREEDLLNAKKYLMKAPKSVTIQSTEFILTGILRQETNFDKYKLI